MLNNDHMVNKMIKITSKTSLPLLVGLTTILVSGTGQAATVTWSGATSSDWSTGANWSPANAPTSADMARFMWSTANAPTLGAGSFITTKIYFYSSGALPNYSFTGAGSGSTTLKIDPNSGSTVSFIENAGSTSGGINQTLSNLTLLLQNSVTGGQSKIQPGDGRSVTIASNATLQIGSTTAQSVILEANGSGTGSGALNVNGVLKAGVSGSAISVDQSGVLNLNLAAGSDFTNLQLSSKSGGVINFLAGGALGGSVSIYSGGVANVSASGMTLNTTEFSIVSGGKISTTYTSGTSTLGGLLSLANGAGGPTSTFEVASGGTLALANRVQSGSASAIIEETANGTLALTYSGGAGNSFLASAFNVRAGTLLVNNTGNTTASAAAVNIFSGATLAGAGRITGATTISGILAPGNSIGTLTVANDVIWNGGASPFSSTNWKFELGTANTADLLNITGVSGNFTKGTGSVFRFDFQGSTATGTFKLVDWVGTTAFTIADFSYTNLGPGLKGSFQFNGSQLEFVSENKGIPIITTPPTASAITVGEALSSSALANDGVASTAGTFTFTDSRIVPSTTGSYSASVTFTPEDSANYTTTTITVSVMVNPETPIGTTFAGWSGNEIATPELVAKYAIGGASGPNARGEAPTVGRGFIVPNHYTYIEALVRTDDSQLSFVAEASTDLSVGFSSTGTWTVEGAALGVSQVEVPPGCERKKFIYWHGIAQNKMFLRVNVTLNP
jgi:hypothetical protein